MWQECGFSSGMNNIWSLISSTIFTKLTLVDGNHKNWQVFIKALIKYFCGNKLLSQNMMAEEFGVGLDQARADVEAAKSLRTSSERLRGELSHSLS